MHIKYSQPIHYNLLVGEHKIDLNNIIGKNISLKWMGVVRCICGKDFKKFYRQNFCYQCFWNAPEASPSIFKPELCTADLGIEDRDLEWEKKFQLAPHYVYFANTSGLKVGVTRKNNELARWMDQGAIQAIVIAELPNRRMAGQLELVFKKYLADKTNWRKMLSGYPEKIDLVKEKVQYISYVPSELKQFICSDDTVLDIIYPVNSYPEKIKSLNFQKQDVISGKLCGIKGQYIILDDNRVFNVRAHERYMVSVSC